MTYNFADDAHDSFLLVSNEIFKNMIKCDSCQNLGQLPCKQKQLTRWLIIETFQSPSISRETNHCIHAIWRYLTGKSYFNPYIADFVFGVFFGRNWSNVLLLFHNKVQNSAKYLHVIEVNLYVYILMYYLK